MQEVPRESKSRREQGREGRGIREDLSFVLPGWVSGKLLVAFETWGLLFEARLLEAEDGRSGNLSLGFQGLRSEGQRSNLTGLGLFSGSTCKLG